MKLTILAPALAMCAGLALAQNPGGTTSRTQDKRAGGDHKMTAEVVSTDSTAQQITVRKLSMGGTTSTTEPSSDTPSFTLKVEGKALTSLSSVKSGDKVTLSCKPMTKSATDPSAGGSMGGSITSQAMAEMHCSSVTDISKK